jgi:hypothetical protein
VSPAPPPTRRPRRGICFAPASVRVSVAVVVAVVVMAGWRRSRWPHAQSKGLARVHLRLFVLRVLLLFIARLGQHGTEGDRAAAPFGLKPAQARDDGAPATQRLDKKPAEARKSAGLLVARATYSMAMAAFSVAVAGIGAHYSPPAPEPWVEVPERASTLL